jgi:RNA polymerase sigma factor (sigma-70 family)
MLRQLPRTAPMPPKPASTPEAAELAKSSFERHYRELHRYLARRLPLGEDANDLIQEVFLRVLRLDRSEMIRKPQAYLYGIASNVVHEFLLRGRHDRVTFSSETVEQASEHPAQVSPDEIVERLISERQFERALSQLAPTHRAVLLLHKRDGLSRDEVARELGLSAHTVKKYLCQAMAQIRATWEE